MRAVSEAILEKEDVGILRCPKCSAMLALTESVEQRGGDSPENPSLDCANPKCRRKWPIIDGSPKLVDVGDLHTADSFLNLVYDLIAPFHDFGTGIALPIAQWVSDRTVRLAILDRLDLASLGSSGGRPIRILEVGSGTGINWPLIEEKLPIELDVELWAVDLSTRMLRETRKRARRQVARRVRTIRADVHNLPFVDHSFDRVLHIGAVATFGDPARALAEMARVALPDSPIVVVDERLDPTGRHSLCRRALFKALTWYDPDPSAPSQDLLPRGAQCEVEQVSPFFYCMTYRQGAPRRRRRRGTA